MISSDIMMEFLFLTMLLGCAISFMVYDTRRRLKNMEELFKQHKAKKDDKDNA